MSDYESMFDKWNQGEYLVHAQITGSIEDSMLMKISHCHPATEMWKSLQREDTDMVQVDLRKRMMQKKANEEDNIPAAVSQWLIFINMKSSMLPAINLGTYNVLTLVPFVKHTLIV